MFKSIKHFNYLITILKREDCKQSVFYSFSAYGSRDMVFSGMCVKLVMLDIFFKANFTVIQNKHYL